VFDGDFTAFERITVAAGAEAVAVAGAANDTLPTINDYTLTLVDANVAAATTFTVDASALRTGIITNFGGDAEIGGTGGNADTTAGAENLSLDASGLTGTRAVSVLGGADADTVAGGAGADTISGNGGADSLTGNGGNDTLAGGAGNDTLTGGAGVDRLTGDAGSDVFVFTAASDSTGASFDSITDFTSGTDKIQVNLSGDFNFDASGFASVSSFNDGLVSLSLVRGDGFYSSADGKLYVDVDGNGTISQGTDYVISAATVASGDVNFSLTGGAGANTLIGGAGNDIIDGDGGADSIEGGAGSDRLTGGAAIDTFVLTSTSGTDTITDMALGAGGDVLQVDQSDLGLAGADVFRGAVGGVNANGSEEIVVLDALSYATDADAAAAVAGQVTTDGLAMVIVYHNSTTGKVHVIHTTNSNTGASVTHIATMDNVTTLGGLAAGVNANFGGRP
jgi:Ca2+-binding RTX toxin-like protein